MTDRLTRHSRQRVLVVVASLICVAPACVPFAFGDPLQRVEIENATPVVLRVYQDGANRALPLDVPAHSTVRTAFPWPIDSSDSRARMILAEDEGGKRVYCERFHYRDLVSLKWTIKLIERDNCQ